MKKFLALAMCLAVMMTSFVFVSAEADATITVELVDGPFAAGDEVAIPVTITEWANAYATIELEFQYDDALLELDVIEQSEFSGAMGASNGGKFSLICNPSSDRQASKLLGGEICVAYFYATTDITNSTTVKVTAAVKGYAYGKEDNWTQTVSLECDVVNGGVKGASGEHECVPAVGVKYDETYHWYDCRDVGCDKEVNKAPHEGGTATCNGKAICSVCSAEYGAFNPENHAGGTELRNQTDTYSGDLYCLSCNEIITQGEGTGPVIPTEYDATITVETVDGYVAAGEEVAISVNISEWATAYGSVEILLNYDKTLLQIDYIEASETDFSGAMSASSGGKFALIANPSTEKQANKVKGGEVCVAYFTALTNITESTVVGIKESIVYAYTNGKDDTWTDARILTVNVVDGGIYVDPNSEDIPVVCTHEGGTATCIAKAVCTLCGEEYGKVDETNHAGETELRNASDYYTGDTYCLDCGKMIDQGDVVESNDVDAIIYVDKIYDYVYAGDEVAIAVNITQWLNAYATIELAIDYDENLLELDAIEPSETDFSGSMTASNVDTKNFALICNPSSERQANKLLGGEICVIYFYAITDIDRTDIDVIANVKGYAYGKDDEWVEVQNLNLEIENGGIFGPEVGICPHEGGTATCCALAICTLCGEQYGELDANNHAGETEIRDASETYTGDTYCLGCGQMIAQGEEIIVPPANLWGDVDGDGRINTVDAMLVSQYYAGYDVDINTDYADVNGDGYANARDAMLICQYYVKLITNFPVEN